MVGVVAFFLLEVLVPVITFLQSNKDLSLGVAVSVTWTSRSDLVLLVDAKGGSKSSGGG